MTEEGGSQRVKYDTKNHFTVLTQMHGSVWPAVMPHCILNTLNICGIIYLDRYRGIDISYSDKGHTFMSMIVSFLVVTRSSIAYSRFMESRSHLATVMKSCRELIQYAVTFTRYDTTETTTKWRYSLARKTIVLLRSVVSVLEFETTGEHVWKNKVLDKREKRALTDAVGEDNFRSPMILAMFLRTTIASNVEFMDEPLHVSRELRLYSFVSEFVTGYHGLTKLIDTQFPFPLAQMTATFVFIWVYSLPAVLYNDDIAIPSLILIVFFITYAFIGLECVSVELDDPFGNDPNDFDVMGLAQVVFQDIYICIYDADGEKSATKLKKFFEVNDSGESEGHRKTLSGLLSSKVLGNEDDDSIHDNEPGDYKSNFLLQAGSFLSGITSPRASNLTEDDLSNSDREFSYGAIQTVYSGTELGTDDKVGTREKEVRRKEIHPLLNP